MKVSRLSLSGKIICLVLFTIVVIGCTTFGLCYYFFSRGFDQQSEKTIELSAQAVRETLVGMGDDLKMHGVSFASRPDLVEAVVSGDGERLRRIAKELLTDNKLEVLTIADKTGKVIARGHSDKAGDSVSNQLNVQRALTGEVTVGIEEGTVVKFSLRAGAPVKYNGQIVGTVTPGLDLSASNNFVDTIKKQFGLECTLFKGDERVITTLEKDGKRIAGTKMENPAIIETVLRKGDKWLSKNTIAGRIFYTAYWPLTGADGKTAGMFFIGKDWAEVQSIFRTVSATVLASVFLAGLLLVAFSYGMSRSMIRPMLLRMNLLNESAAEVSLNANQVLDSSRRLAGMASRQAAATEETASTLEEVMSMTRQNAAHSRQTNDLMEQTRSTVARATRSMGDLTDAMEDISHAGEETQKIIRTIDEIAFQTNLLALNAAVEAARAGEAGAGFAVVADEVRNLAMRSAEAAKNTANLIEGMVKKVRDGSGLVGRTAGDFDELAGSVERSGELVEGIAGASGEQAEGIDRVGKAIGDIDRAVQENAQCAEESSAASEKMSSQARRSRELVFELMALVEGKRRTRKAKAPEPVQTVKSRPAGSKQTLRLPAPPPSRKRLSG